MTTGQLIRRRPLTTSKRALTSTRAAPGAHTQHNEHATLVEALRNKLLLAPLTRGGSLPFRRLVAELGCECSVTEMALARNVRALQTYKPSFLFMFGNVHVC